MRTLVLPVRVFAATRPGDVINLSVAGAPAVPVPVLAVRPHVDGWLQVDVDAPPRQTAAVWQDTPSGE